MLTALDDLERAGYQTQGDEDSWHDALDGLNDAQIVGAVKLVKKGFSFKTIFPAKIVEMANEVSFHGSGGGDLPASDTFETWKDNQGRDYAYHTSFGSRYLSRREHMDVLRVEAEMMEAEKS